MAQFPALTLWTDVWVAETHHLSRHIRGTYMDLLILMWRTSGCSVPNDDGWLATRLHMTLDEVENELRPIIVEFCQTDGNRIWQKRLRIEFERAAKYHRSQSVRAKARWNKGKTYTHADASTHMQPCIATLESKKEDLFSTERLEIETPKKAPRRKKALTSLPDDWHPKGHQRDPSEADEFRNKALAKGWQYANWDAAYTNFQNSEYNARNRRNGSGNGHQPTYKDKRQQELEDVKAALDASIARANEPRESRTPDQTPDGILPFPHRSRS